AVAQELELLLRIEQPRRQPRVVEEPPEVVARVGKVRGRRGRDSAGIDAAEDRLQSRRKDIRDGANGSVCVAHCGQRGRSEDGAADRDADAGRAGNGGAVGYMSSALCGLALPAVEPPLEELPDLRRRDRLRIVLPQHGDMARSAVAARPALLLAHT